ncbi:MAG: F0F1 ATP synthase subunit A [Actinomycetota bacterium]|nr:F0F1 ATP synthase subunit A [Actinomycetota bacterium]
MSVLLAARPAAGMLAAVEYGGEFQVPSIDELFVWPPYFWSANWNIFGIPAYVNRVVLLMFVAVGLSAAIFLIAFGKPKLVPTKLQVACEAFIDFIREQIAEQLLGPRGLPWLPLLVTIFVFVFVNNAFEIVPLIQFPPTSKIALPFFLATMVWLIFVVVGMVHQGPFGYFKNMAFPPGLPKALYVLYAPIEVASVLIVRPLTLTIRLMANMLAGHIILTTIFVVCHVFLALRPGLLVGLVGLAFAPVMDGFELVIGILQAYIFTILTAVYIADSMYAEH